MDSQAVYDNVACLINPVHTINGLLLNKRIPKGLENHNSRSGGEIESEGTTFQTTEKHTCTFVIAETVERSFAVVIAHTTVIAGELVAGFLEERFDEVKHCRELGEDDDFVRWRLFF